jgi:hypothetical protein
MQYLCVSTAGVVARLALLVPQAQCNQQNLVCLLDALSLQVLQHGWLRQAFLAAQRTSSTQLCAQQCTSGSTNSVSRAVGLTMG